MSELAYLGWLEAAERIRRRELSPVEYARAQLERIETYDGSLNAFLRLTPERAVANAERAEAAIGRGECWGPLHGVPFALKDIIDVAGLPTTAHSAILRDNVAAADAEVTARLEAAGGILLGKLSTHEFAIGGPCFDLPWPPARNPWNRDRFPGGSSSGSGVALAAGFVPVALGSDTGGSVRNPASACGIVGMKPTYGRVSRRGVVPLAYSLDTVGPMTRTVAENAALLNLIAGHDPADPASARRAREDFSVGVGRGITGLRLGVLRHFYMRDLVADPVVTEAIETALGMFESLGAEVAEIETRPYAHFADCNRVLLQSEAYAVHEQWMKTRPFDYAAQTRERLLAGAFLSASDYVQATRVRRELTAAMDAAMADVDVLITASSLDPPCRIDDEAAVRRTFPRQARSPFNLTGQPAIAIPCGFTSDGLPLSLQIVGRAFDEATIYRVADAYEQATRWTERHPQLHPDPNLVQIVRAGPSLALPQCPFDRFRGHSMSVYDLTTTDALLSTTRSVRKRLDLQKPVPRQVILDCIALSQQAPTGSNSQDWRWLVVTDADKRRALAELYYRDASVYLAPTNQESVTGGDAQTSRVIDSARYLMDHLHEVPVHVIPCIEVKNRKDASPEHWASVMGSIYPAVWSFNLALRARGLGSVLTTLHLSHADEAAALLGIPDNMLQAGLLPVAYTLGTDFRPAQRPPPESITRWEHW